MKIKQMNKQERPREKAIHDGIHTLSNRELLAILLRSGSKQMSVLELSDFILHQKNDLLGLLDLHIEDLIQIPGIKYAKATQLLACLELCKRIAYQHMKKSNLKPANNKSLPYWLMQSIGHQEQEYFTVVFLNARNKMITYKHMFIGTNTQSFANPREIFIEALRHNAAKIICAHNHPSGDVKPSSADFNSASLIEQCGDLIGIKVIDHLIVSANDYYSFYEENKMLEQQIQTNTIHFL